MAFDIDTLQETEITTLKDVIAVVYDTFPEARGLFQTLLGTDDCLKLVADSKQREEELRRA